MPEQTVEPEVPAWNPETVEKQASELESPPEASQPEPQKPKDTPEVELSRTKAALSEARAQKKAEAARARQYERELAEMRQQVAALRQPAPQPPDLAQNPAERLLFEQQQIKEQLARNEQERHIERQVQAQRQQVEGFVSHVRSLNDEFAREQPDANDGINFLKTARVSEYLALGMSQQEATQAMLRDEVQLAQWAISNGENPSKLAFEMAKARGYVSSKQKLEMQEQGQRASMPQGTGRSGGKVSLEALAKLPRDEFAKATAGSNWEKLMKNL